MNFNKPKFEDRSYGNFEEAFKAYFEVSEYNDITKSIYAMLKTAFVMGWIAAGGPLPGSEEK